MAEAKTKPTAVSVDSFLAQAADPVRQADCRKLVTTMACATGAPACMWGTSIAGFGRYGCKYDSGREGESMVTGFFPRKSDLTVYIVPGFAATVSSSGEHRRTAGCARRSRSGFPSC